VAPQDSQNFRGDFAKRKQTDAEFAGNSLLRTVIIDIVSNTLLGRVIRHPAHMHCPCWDDAFVSSLQLKFQQKLGYQSLCRIEAGASASSLANDEQILFRRLYFPSPETDSWICSSLFSVCGLWFWLGLVLIGSGFGWQTENSRTTKARECPYVFLFPLRL